MAFYKVYHVEPKPRCKSISAIMNNKESVPLSVRVFRERHHAAFSYYSPGMPGYIKSPSTNSQLVRDLAKKKAFETPMISKLVEDLAEKKTNETSVSSKLVEDLAVKRHN